MKALASMFGRIFIAISILTLPAFALTPDELDKAAETFIARCAICHGNTGLGEGNIPLKIPDYPPTNIFDSRKHESKKAIRSVINNGLPSEELTKFMPPWENELSEKEIEHLTDLILLLRKDLDTVVPVLQDAANRTHTKTTGKSVYEARCVLCHGTQGKGDGRMAKIIKTPPPADLTKSVAPSVYVTMIVSKGGQAVGRSPQMPPWEDQLTEKELEAVVNYLMEIRL